jgi:hypothetical protein
MTMTGFFFSFSFLEDLGIAVYFQTTHCLSSDPCDCVAYDFNWGRPLLTFTVHGKDQCAFVRFNGRRTVPKPFEHTWQNCEKLKT